MSAPSSSPAPSSSSPIAAQASEAAPQPPSANRYARGLIARIQKNQDDVEAIRLLEAHYVEAGDHASLVHLLEGWGNTLRAARAAADAYVSAADTALLGLEDRERARTLYERALSRDPTHAQALDRVLRLLTDAGEHDREKQVLKYVAHQLEQRKAAGNGQEQSQDEVAHLASVLYRLGQLYETHYGNPGKAAAGYRRAIEHNPKLTAAIVAARRIYADVGNTHAVAVLYEFEIEAVVAPEDKRALLLALAELRETEQQDLDAAVHALRRVLQLVPSDVEALRKLGELLVRRSERPSASGDAAAVDRRRAAEVFYQVGRSVPERNAGSYLTRALELDPEHERATQALVELARQRSENSNAQRGEAASEASASAQRDSAEAWLHGADAQIAASPSTGQLLPIEVPQTSDAPEQRPSSLPPRELATTGFASFPPQDALRAPRIPSAQAPRRSSPPPPPAGRPPRSVPPPPPAAPPAAKEAALASNRPPPAYAEIPGASSDDFTPARTQRPSARPPALPEPAPSALRGPRQAEPTLAAWRLPDDARQAAAEATAAEPTAPARPSTQLDTHDAAVRSAAPTPAIDVPAAILKASVPEPARGTRLGSEAPPPTAARPSRATTKRPSVAPRSSQPAGAPQAPIKRMRDHQDDRVARALQGARKPSSIPAPPMPSGLASEAPRRAQPSSAATPRACLVDGELLRDPARTPIEVNLGATTDSNFYVGFSSRIADGGVFIATYQCLPIGTEVELLVTLPGNFSARAHGKVRLVRDALASFGDDTPGMCVELEALSYATLALFERFAQKRAPLFMED
jgi:tetratricopeptide (TPR) repeat protein/Tfp pilus assembly protein PilZ